MWGELEEFWRASTGRSEVAVVIFAGLVGTVSCGLSEIFLDLCSSWSTGNVVL